MVSTDNSPQSEFQMVSANGPTSANGESLPTYHDLVQHYDLFWNTLRDFHRFSNITVKYVLSSPYLYMYNVSFMFL